MTPASLRTILLVSAFAGLLAGSGSAQTTIGNGPPNVFNNAAVSPFGKGSGYGSVMGQTFTAPGDATLNRFSFWLSDAGNGGALLFSAYIKAWDGTQAVGAALFESGARAGAAGGMEEFSFATAGLALTPGAQYVAYLDAFPHKGDIAVETALNYFYTHTNNPYAGGNRAYFTRKAEFPLVSGDHWRVDASYDAFFRAEFGPTGTTVTPEPVSLALLATGLAGLGGLRRQRRRHE